MRLTTFYSAVLVTGLVLGMAWPAAAAVLEPGGTFTDDDGNTHEADIEAIAADGITKGCNPPFGDRFCPDQSVERGEMAAFLRRALGLPASSVDHFVDDDGSIFEGDIDALAEAGVTKGCNPPVNDRFCLNDPVTRAQMASFITRAFGLVPMAPPDRPPLDWEVVADGFSSPVQALVPAGEERILVVQQGGKIFSYQEGAKSTFLDIEDEVLFSGERGLLSAALHPDYPADRRLFVWYTGNDGHTRLVEFDISADLTSASSPRAILQVDQPASNHNGGFIDFGPDGYLYLGLGDGGGGNDTFRTARDLDSLLGKMIRIDVDDTDPGLAYSIPDDNPYVGTNGRDEIWASGLRNPWRWSFDEDRIYIGDVGQSTREEINVVDVSPVGYDFGWSRYEGSVCNPNDHDASCATSGLTFPVEEYGRTVGRSVIGGVVYRGSTVRSLAAYYLYGDIGGAVRAFRMNDGSAVERLDLSSSLGLSGIVSFSTDWNGEVLVVSLFTGTVYRLVGG